MDTDRYRDALKLVGYAVSLDTDEVYEAAGKPLPSRLAPAVRIAVTRQATESGLDIDPDDTNITSILQYGIDDLQDVFHQHFWKQPSYEAALNFVNHEHTVQAIAALALNTEDGMRSLIRLLDKDPYRVQSATPYLRIPSGMNSTMQGRGCPAAKHGENQPIKPIFQKFVRWSGKLAVQSLAHHRIVPAFVTDDTE